MIEYMITSVRLLSSYFYLRLLVSDKIDFKSDFFIVKIVVVVSFPSFSFVYFLLYGNRVLLDSK